MKKTTLNIKGMHCPSCEVLIKDKFEMFPNIKLVKANYKTQKVEVGYLGNLNKTVLNNEIKPFGYQIVEEEQDLLTEPITKKIMDAGIIAIIIFIVYFIAQEFGLIPEFNNGGAPLTLVSVFILGLVASTSTCMATSGALFLATIGKLDNKDKVILVSEERAYPESISNLFPTILFNLGRILSYGFFGFILGYIGKTLVANLQFGPFLTLIVAILMILVGLDMLKILPFSTFFQSSLTTGLFEKIQVRLKKNPGKTAFLIGAITYLLPCGFTQTIQLYALGLADPIQSALVMIVFAIGTAPALMAIGTISLLTKSDYYPLFQKVIAVLIVIFGVYYFMNFLGMYGINIGLLNNQNQTTNNTNVIMEKGVQVARMNVNSNGYDPTLFIIKKGIPVHWIIYGEDVFGCQGYFMVPNLGYRKALKPGENIIDFTPKEVGNMNFSCGMGMYRGKFEVVE